jgi:uncharacterized membrane protein
MPYHERQIVAWLFILVGAYFLARAVGSKREKHAMKELLGVRIDKVKFFRNFFIQRLESIVGFVFVLVGVSVHLYVHVRQAQQASAYNDPKEALRDIGGYLLVAVFAMLVITAVMHVICSYFAKRTFLDILGYLMVRYKYRIEDDPDLLVQIGNILGAKEGDEETIESYTKRIEEGLHLDEIRARLQAKGKIPR